MRRQSCIFILLFIAIASSTSSAALQAFPIVNLAFGKTASQSSTDTNPFNGKPMSPNLAIDGNADGDISHGSVAQTTPNGANPWWQVDLGKIAYIDIIQIYLPADDTQVFKSFYVFVSDNEFSQDFNTTFNNSPHSQLLNITGSSTFTVNFQRTGRYVRIWMSTGSQLSLAEVQIPGIQLSTNPGIVGQWAPMLPPLYYTPDDDVDVGDTWNTLSLVHLSLLPSKKLLFWGRDKRDKNLDLDPTHQGYVDDVDGKSDAYLWDWSSSDPNSWLKRIPNTTANLFCAGHSFLRDGNLFVAGGAENAVDNTGTKLYDGDGNGERQTHIFDWKAENWKDEIAGQVMRPVMRQPRWYPSLVTLSNGETLIISGDFVTFDENNNRVIPFPVNKDTEILDRDGKLRRVMVVDPNDPGNLLPSDLPLALPNYPFAHLGPDGRVLVVSGTSKDGLIYNPSKEGLICDPSKDLNCGPWLRQANLDLTGFHDVGTSVMYDKGKVMAIGGRVGESGVTRSTETIDLNQINPQWTPATPMHFERYYATSVLMPDGEIFIIGGSKCGGTNNIQSPDGTCRNGAVMYPEIYNSVPQTWSIMAPQTTIRMYHSVALLLPDATILVAGGGRPGAFGEDHTINPDGMEDPVGSKYLAHHQVEKFSPPYLFNADGTWAIRPTITSNPFPPSTLTYGQSFNLGIGNLAATQIQQVVLVRLPSVTHALNFDQRRVVLTYQVLDQQTLSVMSPANGIEAPPGPYMLFVIGPNGVPSTAEMITSLDYPLCSSPPPPTGLVATATSNGRVSISWTAPNVAVHHYELDRKQSVSAAFVKIADINSPATSYTDQNVTGSVAYLYRVRAVCPSGSSSQPSNMDLATTMIFTNDPLTAGVTIQAQHINELRIAVNTVRATAGLAQAGWTDASVQSVSVKALHITELRQNLNQALQAMGFTPPAYTDSTLNSGVTVKKAHIEEIRQALR